MSIYDIQSPQQLLSGNPYPGRGIVLGMTPDGTKAVAAYFIMGRSENSRNRVFVEKDGEVFTEPFDASRVEDPSLIIYAAVRQGQPADRHQRQSDGYGLRRPAEGAELCRGAGKPLL